MYKRNASEICWKIDAEFNAHFRKVPWTDVYKTEDELISALEDIEVPANKTAPSNTFKGYEYIYSFASRLQNGVTLTDGQLRQAKRLALEIYKAVAIQE